MNPPLPSVNMQYIFCDLAAFTPEAMYTLNNKTLLRPVVDSVLVGDDSKYHDGDDPEFVRFGTIIPDLGVSSHQIDHAVQGSNLIKNSHLSAMLDLVYEVLEAIPELAKKVIQIEYC